MNRRWINKFLSYYKPYRGWLMADITCAMASTGIGLILPLLISHITDTLLTQGADAAMPIVRTGLVMVALLVVRIAFTYVYDAKGHAMGALIERDMRADLFAHFQSLSFSFFDAHQPGALLSNITHDLLNIAEVYHHAPEEVIINLVKFIGAAVILFHTNAALTWIVLAFLPMLAVFTGFISHRLNRVYRRNLENISLINAGVEESLSGIRTAQAYGGQAYETEKFRRNNEAFLQSRKRIYSSESILSTGTDTLLQLITVAVAVFGGLAILRQEMGLPAIITFLLYAGYLSDPVRKVANPPPFYRQSITGFARFMEALETEPTIIDRPNALPMPRPTGALAFTDVSFQYAPDLPAVLMDINLTIAPGEKVALVGCSGVGKTTLCSLLSRFYDVTGGQISVDGHDVRDVRLADLRAGIGIVQQEVYLFSGTVADNIAYGQPGATADAIERAARLANAHAFILALEKGYDTPVGHHGVRLSGGQRQRISIARAFLKDPVILILDEATSSLDSQSEAAVLTALHALMENRTTLIIAHRLSTIRVADRILVIENGVIAESGTHEALLAGNGVYTRLYGEA